MAEFVFAAKTDDIPAGRGKTVSLGKKRIALFNVDGVFYAIDDTCLGAVLWAKASWKAAW